MILKQTQHLLEGIYIASLMKVMVSECFLPHMQKSKSVVFTYRCIKLMYSKGFSASGWALKKKKEQLEMVMVWHMMVSCTVNQLSFWSAVRILHGRWRRIQVGSGCEPMEVFIFLSWQYWRVGRQEGCQWQSLGGSTVDTKTLEEIQRILGKLGSAMRYGNQQNQTCAAHRERE